MKSRLPAFVPSSANSFPLPARLRLIRQEAALAKKAAHAAKAAYKQAKRTFKTVKKIAKAKKKELKTALSRWEKRSPTEEKARKLTIKASPSAQGTSGSR